MVVVGGAVPHGWPQVTPEGHVGRVGERGELWAGEKEKEWMDCVAEDLRLSGITGDWNTAALDPGVCYSTVQDGGCRFMAAWAKEDEKSLEHRQRKRKAEEVEKVEVAPGVPVASLRRFRAALIGPTQGLRKRRRRYL